jgi:FkbM family methyltransferase
MLSYLFVSFYRFWHGKLHLKGAGVLLRVFARILPEFEHYRLNVPNLGRLTVNLRDSSGIAWLNYSLGDTGLEEGLISAVQEIAPANPVIWDVGANAGFFVAALVQRLKGYSEVRLFEPNPKLIPGLRELANCLPNLHLDNLAFSDKPGILTMYIPTRDSTTASLKPKAGAVAVKVECTTGDIFLNNTGAPDPSVIIIDTEGNDCRVINGLAGLIERKRPVIFFENIFETAETIRAALPGGYRQFTVDDKSGDLLPGLDKSRGHNSVFVPQT